MAQAANKHEELSLIPRNNEKKATVTCSSNSSSREWKLEDPWNSLSSRPAYLLISSFSERSCVNKSRRTVPE